MGYIYFFKNISESEEESMNTNDFLNGIGETLTKKAKELSGHAEDFYDRQKLRGQILVEKRDIEKIRGEIGEVIYKSYKEGAELDEELKALCEEIDLHQERIDSIKSDIADNKGKKICPHCQASIDKDALYCPTCGEPVPVEKEADVAEDVKDAAEEAVEAAESAAEDVKEAVEDAVDEIKNAAEDAVEAVQETVEAAADTAGSEE